MQNKLKALEQQVKVLTERDHEVRAALTRKKSPQQLKANYKTSDNYHFKARVNKSLAFCFPLQNIKKQRVAEAALDSMKQQVVDLCRSDTLSKTRQQHDRDLTIMKEQHEAAVLTLQQKLDSTAQALDEQVHSSSWQCSTAHSAKLAVTDVCVASRWTLTGG